MPLILIIFILVPLAEIYLLIQVGSVIGAAWTIFSVVATAVLGAYLVRRQGFAAVSRIRSQLEAGELPALEMLEGLFLLVAGALLLTPGFFTDAVGFACLTPPLRRWTIGYLLQRGVVQRPGGGATRAGGPRTIEGEYHRVDD